MLSLQEVCAESYDAITIEPEVIRITGRNRQTQLLITGHRKDGTLDDLTSQATLSIQDESVATLSNSLVLGQTEGTTNLTVQLDSFQQSIPIHVAGYQNYPPVNFEVDIIPLLTKLNCNGGGCHGRQGGQNGFQLSVFGFDPATDYEALTRQGRGRRVFPGAIEQSLIYSKATGLVAHGGGERMEVDSQDAELLREWLIQGMPWGREGTPTVQSIEVTPPLRSMKPRSLQQLRVVATYTDGTKRDVTRASIYSTNMEIIADCNAQGVIESGKLAGRRPCCGAALLRRGQRNALAAQRGHQRGRSVPGGVRLAGGSAARGGAPGPGGDPGELLLPRLESQAGARAGRGRAGLGTARDRRTRLDPRAQRDAARRPRAPRPRRAPQRPAPRGRGGDEAAEPRAARGAPRATARDRSRDDQPALPARAAGPPPAPCRSRSLPGRDPRSAGLGRSPGARQLAGGHDGIRWSRPRRRARGRGRSPAR